MTQADGVTHSDPMSTLKALSRNEQVFLGATLLTFIFSFIAFAHISIDGFGNTITAWHGVGVLAALLILAAFVVALVGVLAPETTSSVGVSALMIATGLAALALLFFLIRWLTLPGGSVGGIHYGYSLYWGGYVTLILNVVAIVFGALGIKASGEAMPWESRAATAPADPAAPVAPTEPPPAPPAAPPAV